MNRTNILLLFSLSIYLLSSCGKSGCKAPEALNYNSAAKFDDGSCNYFAEQFVGNYKAFDSTQLFLADTLFVQGTHQFNFELKKIDKNYVYFENFLFQGIGYTFILNREHLIFTDSLETPVIRQNDYFFRADTFFYNVTTQMHSSVQKNQGFAIKSI